LPAYTTRRFLALILISILAGILVITATESSIRYFYPTAPQPDFSIACCWPVNDGTLLVSAAAATSSSYNSWITINSLDHFTGTIQLTSNLPLPVSVNPSTVTLTSGARIQSSLTVSVPSGTPLGTYTGTLTGTSGSLSKTVSIRVDVVSPPPDYTIIASSTSVGIPAGSSTSISLQLRSLNGFAGTIALNPSITPNGLLVSVNPSTITLVSGAEAQSTIAIGPMPATAPANGFTITVNATGAGPSHSVAIHVLTGQAGPDFSVSCCWPSYDGNISIASGSTYSSTAKLESLNNFTGTLSLSVNLSLPSSVYPSTISIPPPGTGVLQLAPTVTISAPANTPPGLYIGNMAATNGSRVHFATLTVRVSAAQTDFGISSSTSILIVHAGHSNTSSIGLWSINGFAGSIALSASTTPSPIPGITLSVAPPSLTLTANGAASSILTIAANNTAKSGNFTVLITGSFQSSVTGPSTYHSVAVIVMIIGAPPAVSGSSKISP
jgi:hypothetical protein